MIPSPAVAPVLEQGAAPAGVNEVLADEDAPVRQEAELCMSVNLTLILLEITDSLLMLLCSNHRRPS